MRRSSLRTPFVPILLLLTVTAWITACGPEGAMGDDPSSSSKADELDDGPPLANYEILFEGAPENESLPFVPDTDAVYPAEFSTLTSLQSPVKSQGRRGVCSIFSTVGLMEHLYIKAGHEVPDFSEQYLQWSVKVQVGSFPHSSGSNAGSNLRAITRYGIPEEGAWPYEIDQWNESNDSACRGEEMPTRCYTNGDPPQRARDAKKFFLPDGRYISTYAIKEHLYTEETGVVVGVDFFYQSWNHRKSVLPTNRDYWDKGYVLFPNSADIEESHRMRAGHSILLLGWDDDLEVTKVDNNGQPLRDAQGNEIKEKGFFLFKNSWGTGNFGAHNVRGDGYGYISMKYIQTYGSARISEMPSPP